MWVGQGYRSQCGSHHAQRKQLNEPAASPRLLNLGTEHPQTQHVPEPMPEFEMDHAIGDQLPKPAMLHHLNRRKCEVVAQVDPERDPEHLQQQDEQEYARIDSDEPAHCPRKRRQAQGHGFAGSSHKCPLCWRDQFYSLNVNHRSGVGTTARLRCPALSRALTAKTTLSFESFIVVRVTLPTFWACSHTGLVVDRHSTSYAVASPPGEA